MWITPKLNWTRTDYYNFEDLNRVENNSEVVAGLVGYFIGLPPLTFLTDRSMKRIEFADSLNRIESNQDVLRQRYTPFGWMHRAGSDAQRVPKKIDGAFGDVRLDVEDEYLWFDGVDDYVQSELLVPELTINGSYTVEAYVYHDSAKSVNVFTGGSGASNRHGCTIEGREVRFAYYSPSTGYVSKSKQIEIGKWNRIVCINENGKLKLFVNGEEGTGATQPYLYPSNGVFYLGINLPNHERSYPFSGKMKSIKIWNKALTNSEINSDAPNDGLVLDWNLTKAEGGAVSNKGKSGGNGILRGAIPKLDYYPFKTVELAPINLSFLDQYESSIIEWEADTPEGTGIIVEYSFDKSSWTPLQSGQSLPFRKGDWLTGRMLFLRQRLYTNDQSKTPTIRNFRYEVRGYQTKVDWKANDPFDFNDALRLEYNLNLLYEHYKGNAEAVPICGAFICGEEVI